MTSPGLRNKSYHSSRVSVSESPVDFATVLSEISSLALRHLAPPAAGLYKTGKRKQRSSELDAVFSFSFCGEDEIRTRDTVTRMQV